MSDSREDETKSGEDETSPGRGAGTSHGTRTASIPMPSRFPSEPIQFRVRGSTITAASPPKFVSLEEIMKAAHGIENMALAHEIAIDQDFRLEPFEPPDNSYQKLIKDTMHRAFFDLLREELEADPPIYKQALFLLQDVKKGLFSILLPRHVRIKQVIEEVLDEDFIKQQAENSALDFQKYAGFVIDLMGKLAAPARDDMIQDITKLTDTVEVYRAILETLEVLKLDLANTLVAMIRPHVQAQSVAYEKQKFEEFLKVQEDGLEFTREWILRNLDKTDLSLPVTDQIIIRNVTAQTLAKAYLELLEWDEKRTAPETVLMDISRFTDLSQAVFKLVGVASVMLVSPSCSAADEHTVAKFKQELKTKLNIILDCVTTEVELAKTLPSMAEQVISSTEELLQQLQQQPLTSELKELVRNQITALRDPEHKVRTLVAQRVKEFLKDILVCSGGSRPVPIGLSTFKEELTSIAGTLLRYVMHNKAVFTSYYMDIVERELRKA